MMFLLQGCHSLRPLVDRRGLDRPPDGSLGPAPAAPRETFPVASPEDAASTPTIALPVPQPIWKRGGGGCLAGMLGW